MKHTERVNTDVTISRLGDGTQTFPFEAGKTVRYWLEKAGIELGATEKAYVAAKPANIESDELEEGDKVQVIGKKDGGQ